MIAKCETMNGDTQLDTLNLSGNREIFLILTERVSS